MYHNPRGIFSIILRVVICVQAMASSAMASLSSLFSGSSGAPLLAQLLASSGVLSTATRPPTSTASLAASIAASLTDTLAGKPVSQGTGLISGRVLMPSAVGLNTISASHIGCGCGYDIY